MSASHGSGAHAPPEVPSDGDSTSSDPLDGKGDEGWEDIEPDDEAITAVSLFDTKTFPNVIDMLHYCKDQYGFDLWQIRKDLALDFFGMIKLVNYVRSEVKAGNLQPYVSSGQLFDDEKYLKPVLEDDAVLYSLDDIFDDETHSPVESELEQLRTQLAQLQAQFSAYREEVQKALTDKLDDEPPAADSTRSPASREREKAKDAAYDADYFTSYAYNSIHETMLKDTIRTDAYRDFIYDHKHLFQGKTVLDVGCGTGILSLFCAKAGAKLVVAVDNSAIIDKARQNVFDNGMQDVIKCLHGKIEEVTLPVAQVDVIVSEWMGYCLLYESMLDSVLYARDHYLAPQGLMVPSHATLRIAPLADSDIVASQIDFWNDVYGFTMAGMREGIYDEPLVQSVDPASLAADSVPFLTLDMHTAQPSDLTFLKPFSLTWKDSFERLEGFVVWFDIFFLPSPQDPIHPAMSVPEAQKKGIVSFSTGPHGRQTHWQQGVFLIKDPSSQHQLFAGDSLEGQIGYQKREGQVRSLDIEIRWKLPGASKKEQRQTWFLN